tara:strand:+ start:208 stop:1578 length:1371 start_codon:yes stop_codon:yes gene_type:complete
MLKKFFTYPVFLILFLSFIGMMGFGVIVKYNYEGGEKYQFLQKPVMLITSTPFTLKKMIKKKSINDDVIIPIDDIIYDNLKFFDKKIPTAPLENLILISRHDGDLGRSIVEIRDLNTFEVLHSYKPNIEEIYKKIDLTKDEFKYMKRDRGVNRFFMWHPSITNKGELIFHSGSPLVKIDFNNNVVWVNDKDNFTHSTNLDDEENIYVPSYYRPYSKLVSSYVGLDDANEEYNFLDGAINILDKNGKILFSKSVTEILIENGYLNRIFSQQRYEDDPIHLNDIQPVLKDTKYFKKGDLFLSLRNLSMIILYRPSTNKIIKAIEGEFYNQHDVDIIDESRISIYNNNVIHNYKNERIVENNEIVIYNFETNSFSKKFEKTFIENKINSNFHGLIDFLQDGSAIVEDRMNGRIFYLSSKGEVIWVFNNLNSKKQIYDLWWARVLDVKKSKKISKLLEKR